MQAILRVTVALLGVGLVASSMAAEKKAKGALAPHPISKTFYVTGVNSAQQVAAINDAVAKLPSVTAVKELTPTSGYVRVDFDTHKIASHLVAQTIMDQGPFTVTLKFEIPEYANNTVTSFDPASGTYEGADAMHRSNARVHRDSD